MENFIPCYLVRTKRQSVLVKGDIEAWIVDHGLKWKKTKRGWRLYAGRELVEIWSLSPESMNAIKEIFGDPEYDPTTI